jgi:hypothetical protein
LGQCWYMNVEQAHMNSELLHAHALLVEFVSARMAGEVRERVRG